MMASNDSNIQSPIKCGICRTEIVEGSRLYQVGRNLSVICGDCREIFSDEDLEVVLNLFILYGGYFGMLKRKSYPTTDFVGDLVEELDASEGSLDIEQVNLKMLHSALMHGLTPEQYINKLRLFIE
ncbi:hypothetical protein LCGC14_1259570 [marine sediment metagenome]|uniref:Uncharacterized protein n=1 Tax=marine sediment metagenome TaxID=412755 RepID=A0A0F9L3K4_9ZZZZ